MPCPVRMLQFLSDWSAKLWSRFFCLSVYVTMYLNDHQRSAFYESLGLDTTQFNRCVCFLAAACMHARRQDDCVCSCFSRIHACRQSSLMRMLSWRSEPLSLSLLWTLSILHLRS